MRENLIFNAIIVGGGATGAGIARDLSLRGLKVILFEKKDIAEGTTGRCHGLLHSGARYVKSDPVAAKECSKENKILKNIAPHIIDPCNGYFVGFEGDDPDYIEHFPQYCLESGVECEEIPLSTFKNLEPECNNEIIKVYKVSDAYIDPFLLTYYNIFDAENHGAEIHSYTKVIDLIRDKQRIIGVATKNMQNGENRNYYGNVIVNATGPWANEIEEKLDVSDPLQLIPMMGTLIIYDKRLVNSVINRLAYPKDGDIIVPSHQSIIVGTTSNQVKSNNIDSVSPTESEIQQLKDAGVKLIPKLENSRMLRYYSGVRPLVKLDQTKKKERNGEISNISRKFVIVDYENQGFPGLITVFGGKMTTYRLMAEEISDLICSKLGNSSKCTTHEKILPGGKNSYSKIELKTLLETDDKNAFDISLKWGSFIEEMTEICQECLNGKWKIIKDRIICKCESVSESEIRWVKENLHVARIDDYRRRTRQGMGRCQGQFCLFKIADIEIQLTTKSHTQIIEELKEALFKRWKTEKWSDQNMKRQIKLSKFMYLFGGGLN